MSPLLLALAALGFLDALYFTLVTYRIVRPDARWLPRVCRMDEGACARVVDTREARLLGVPNAVVGLAWYAVLATAAVVGFAACSLLLAVAVGALVMSAYLAWALVARLRVRCTLCFLGHAVNIAVVVALGLECFV